MSSVYIGNWSNAKIITQTSNVFVLSDSNNNLIELDGVGFTYSGSFLVTVTGGTVNAVHTSSYTILGTSFQLADFMSWVTGAAYYYLYTTNYNQTFYSTALSGNDVIQGGYSLNHLLGYAGNDQLYAGVTGSNTLDGGAGNDTLYAGPSGDILIGGADQDLLVGGIGNDSLYGDLTSTSLTGGNDTLLGGAGDDYLNGGGGNDSISGGDGNDTIDQSNFNADTVDGGYGIDTVKVSGSSSSYTYTHSGQTLVFSGATRYDNVEYFSFSNGTFDYNALGAASLPSTTLEAAGSTKLVRVGEKYALQKPGSAGPFLKYQGADVFVGQFGAIEPLGTEAYGSGYLVAWKITGADQYIFWTTDSSGNRSGALSGLVSANSVTFRALESVMMQDLNGDGSLAVPGLVVEGAGDTRLSISSETDWYRLSANADDSSVYLTWNGAPVVRGSLGAWSAIGAEAIIGGYLVAWKNYQSFQYIVWSVDVDGNRTGALTGLLAGTDAALEAMETSFQQDLNGDGTIGLTVTTIESHGSTSLVQVGPNFFVQDSTGAGPELSYGGSPVVAGQFGGWAPIGTEVAGAGYQVAWHDAASGLYIVWSVDAAGNRTGAALGLVTGTDAALEAMETSFQQDLNGDGHLGIWP